MSFGNSEDKSALAGWHIQSPDTEKAKNNGNSNYPIKHAVPIRHRSLHAELALELFLVGMLV
jgi:hypothetical protein